MGVQYFYIADGPFSVKELTNIHDNAKNLFKGFNAFNPEQSHMAFLKPKILPKLKDLGSMNITNSSVTGHLKIKDDSIDIFQDILEKAPQALGDMGLLWVSVYFEVKERPEKKRYSDRMWLEIRKAKQAFGYSACISRQEYDVLYQKQFMKRLVDKINLPLEVIKDEKGYCLIHKHSENLWLSGCEGANDSNPATFRCQVHKKTAAEFIDMMRQALKEFASEKRFEYSWTADSMSGNNPEHAQRFYNMVLEAKFPANKYDLELDFTLGDLSGLDSLIQLCAQKDRFNTWLCSFDLPEKSYGEIKVLTTSEGHKIELELSNEDYQGLVEEKFGIKFIPE